MSHSGEPVVHQNKTFSNIDFTEKVLREREFIKCEFISCNFSKSDLRNNDFENCHFKQCNFSLTVVEGTGFRDASFSGCKILGVDFTGCSKFMFSFAFNDCHLDYCIFFGTKLRKTNFIACTLKETDFSEADLTASVFTNCDLAGARFSNTILEKVDFRAAWNFVIDPDGNKMKKAAFSASNLAGLLQKHQLDIE